MKNNNIEAQGVKIGMQKNEYLPIYENLKRRYSAGKAKIIMLKLIYKDLKSIV